MKKYIKAAINLASNFTSVKEYQEAVFRELRSLGCEIDMPSTQSDRVGSYTFELDTGKTIRIGTHNLMKWIEENYNDNMPEHECAQNFISYITV